MATITGIVGLIEKQEHTQDYYINRNSAILPLDHLSCMKFNDVIDYKYLFRHSQSVNGVIKEDKVTEDAYVDYCLTWFEYDLKVKYTSIDNNTFENKCHILSPFRLEVGDRIPLCYLIDSPFVITTNVSSVNTIDEFYRNIINFLCIFIFALLMLLCTVFLLDFFKTYD